MSLTGLGRGRYWGFREMDLVPEALLIIQIWTPLVSGVDFGPGGQGQGQGLGLGLGLGLVLGLGLELGWKLV